jgi:hypothetical protein
MESTLQSSGTAVADRGINVKRHAGAGGSRIVKYCFVREDYALQQRRSSDAKAVLRPAYDMTFLPFKIDRVLFDLSIGPV